MNRNSLLDIVIITTCLVGAVYAAARAAEPVEATGWEGAKQILQQVKTEPELPHRHLCYRKSITEIVDEQTIEVVELHWLDGKELIPVDGGVALTVEEALAGSGVSVIVPGAPLAATVPECSTLVVESP